MRNNVVVKKMLKMENQTVKGQNIELALQTAFASYGERVLSFLDRALIGRHVQNKETQYARSISQGISGLIHEIQKLRISDGSLTTGIVPNAEAFMIRESLFRFCAGIALFYGRKTVSYRSIVELNINRLLIRYTT